MESRTAYIYTLSDPRTGQVRYVGKTFDLRGRLYQHLHDVVRGVNTKKTAWIKSLLKLGFKPLIESVETYPDSCVSDWEEAERFWIETFSFYGFKLVNLDSGGGSGRRASLETRIKIGEYSKKRIHSPETRAKIAASCKARMTPEEKNRIGLQSRGRKHSEETKRRMSEAKKGIPKPDHVKTALLAGSLKWKAYRGYFPRKK